MKTPSKPILAEDFVKLRFAESPTLSNDGRLIFTIRTTDEQKNKYRGGLYLKSSESHGYIRFSSGTHLDTGAQFSPSGEFVAFLSSRTEKGMQVFIMSVKGGEALQITNFPSGVIGFVWSHDNKAIHVIARVSAKELDSIINPTPPKSFVLDPIGFQKKRAEKEEKETLLKDPRVIKKGYYRDGTQYLEGRTTQPFVVLLGNIFQDVYPESKPIVKHIGDISYHYILGVFSSDNSSILLSKYVDDPAIDLTQEILKIDIQSPSEQKLLGKAFGYVSNFQLSPGGRYVSYEAKRIDHSIYDDQQVLIINLNKEGGSLIECVTDKFYRSAELARWLDDKNIIFRSPNNGRITVHKLNVESKAVEELIGGDRNINSFTVNTFAGMIAYEASHFDYPSDIFVTYLSDLREERITEVNSNYIENHPPAQVESFTYQRDGFNLQGWVLLPTEQPLAGKIPVVLEIHGGPAAMWAPHEKTMWHEWNTLAGKGYAVVFCNPRGSDGYGVEFRSAVFENWGKVAAADIMLALETSLRLYSSLDPERVYVTGGSYGGYMTGWLITQTNRFKAAVSQRGVYEFIGFGLTTDIPVWFELQYGEILEHHAKNWGDSPAAHIKNVTTPLLIIHAENDYRVPIISAEQFFWLGKRYGKDMEFIRYPRDGHELSRSGEPRHIVDRINRITDWFDRYSK
jgi:dipeptidyl aminopeptidase/acylaminoacyl peptidase